MNKYVAFYGQKQIDVEAETSYAAQKKAAEVLKVKPNKQYMITIMLAERSDGTQVVHTPVD